jgi:hypothetical protein
MRDYAGVMAALLVRVRLPWRLGHAADRLVVQAMAAVALPADGPHTSLLASTLPCVLEQADGLTGQPLLMANGSAAAGWTSGAGWAIEQSAGVGISDVPSLLLLLSPGHGCSIVGSADAPSVVPTTAAGALGTTLAAGIWVALIVTTLHVYAERAQLLPESELAGLLDWRLISAFGSRIWHRRIRGWLRVTAGVTATLLAIAGATAFTFDWGARHALRSACVNRVTLTYAGDGDHGQRSWTQWVACEQEGGAGDTGLLQQLATYRRMGAATVLVLGGVLIAGALLVSAFWQPEQAQAAPVRDGVPTAAEAAADVREGAAGDHVGAREPAGEAAAPRGPADAFDGAGEATPPVWHELSAWMEELRRQRYQVGRELLNYSDEQRIKDQRRRHARTARSGTPGTGSPTPVVVRNGGVGAEAGGAHGAGGRGGRAGRRDRYLALRV